MDYTEYKKYQLSKKNGDEYTFFYMDIDDNEFCMCEGCSTEAPLHLWDSRQESIYLCELCSNSLYSDKGTAQNNNTANLLLKMTGYFDDCTVVKKGGE